MSSKPATAAGRRRAAARAPAKAAPAGRSKPARAGAARAKASKSGRGKAPKPGRGRANKATRARAARKGSPPRLPAIPHPRGLLALCVLLAAFAGFYLGWLRDSSLVAVRDVEVTGVTSTDHRRITRALTAAAHDMTTLHLREDELEAAVARFPTVESLSADGRFPHGVTIEVTEREPTMLARAGGDSVLVAADGKLLSGAKVKRKVAKALPALEVAEMPASGRLEGKELETALVVGAAPDPLRPLIESVGWSSKGVEVTVRGGIPIIFASGTRAGAKWAAAAAVLADRKLDALSYLDVRVPERPALGGVG